MINLMLGIMFVKNALKHVLTLIIKQILWLNVVEIYVENMIFLLKNMSKCLSFREVNVLYALKPHLEVDMHKQTGALITIT